MLKKNIAKKLYDRSIFIFRRDLRLEDNTALQKCLDDSTEVIPCFFLDEKQLKPSLNPYYGDFSVQFMCQSLIDLNEYLKENDSRLFLFKGEYTKFFEKIISQLKPQAIYLNEDYSPYSKERDLIIEKICKKISINFYSEHDYTLLEKDKVKLSTGKFYKKFTPYYRSAVQHQVRKPEKNTFKNYIKMGVKFDDEFLIDDLTTLYKKQEHSFIKGGRKEALKLLDNIKNLKNYDKIRDFPTKSTTNLSAYNKFGCISIREFYWKIKGELGSQGEPLLRQLYWRDFYYYILNFYPEVIEGAMKPNYRLINWENNEKLFDLWKNGMTGCPIVDAGMRCMNKTGYMNYS